MSQNRAATTVATCFLIAANLLIPISILTFATGFFPYKPYLPGLAQFEDVGFGPPPPPLFDKVIFMVVDALRSDFVYAKGSGFEYTQELIRDSAAIPFTAHATSPTITMPRIKAITTGSIPSFLDVILNFDEADTTSSLASQDTWLAQMKAKGTGKLVMHGDDTWLKLFPGMFDRADGTSSFFVSDFTEVDNNVTRHVSHELQMEDWNTVVLHYLGLDHIGHKAGPRSPNMVPKQLEMDSIVKQIYMGMETRSHLKSSLLVLCGDHGMNDAGNHGGSSPGETSPALVFVSPKFKALSQNLQVPPPFQEDFQYYTTVEQSDLAPTMGALLGFPVPKNNLGAFIPELLPLWPDENHQVHILLSNARQIMSIITASLGGSTAHPLELSLEKCSTADTEIEELACEYEAFREGLTLNSESPSHQDWVESVVKWLRRAQGVMSSMASNYNILRLVYGQALVLTGLGLGLAAAVNIFDVPAMSLVVFATISVAYGVMMFASSYVEEEQHFWYWATTAWLVILGCRGLKSTSGNKAVFACQVLLVAVAARLVRGWNMTGQKHAGEPDIVKTFLVTNPSFLWQLITISYAWLYYELVRRIRGPSKLLAVGGVTLLVVAAFIFKVSFTFEDSPEIVIGPVRLLAQLSQRVSLVGKARYVFALLGLMAAYVTSGKWAGKREALQMLYYLYSLLAATQSRATNIPLLYLFHLQYLFLQASDLNVVEISVSSILLQFMSFFAFGGSNAISSIDLSSAYNGVSGFNVAMVGILTFVSNWAGPIYFSLGTATLLLRKKDLGNPNVFLHYSIVLSLFTVSSLTFVMAACTALRTHLFIWTVFSPKYLFSMAWSLGQHLGINIGVIGLVFWFG